MADKWLESLMKVHQKPVKAPATPDVPFEFRELTKSDIDALVAPTVGKVYLSDPDHSDIPDPVGPAIAKVQEEPLNKAGDIPDAAWLEIVAAETPRPSRDELFKAEFGFESNY